MKPDPAVWFPAVRCGTGADVFTETLVTELQSRGLRAEITWLPLRAEYAPWTVPVLEPPQWANIVHVNTWLHPRFVPSGLPVVATMHHCVHDPAFRPYKTAAQALYHRIHIMPMERRVLKRADAIVAVSQFTAERTQAAFGPMPIRVIPNGICVDEPFRPVASHSAREPFRLVFVGSGSRRKGVDLLVPIMEQLGPKFELSVVGTSQIGQLPLPPNIRVKGRLATIDSLAAAYRDADALLFPSRLEGFGLVAVEAMACGLPVIATRGSSLTEVVEDGVTGILCAQDDVADFVEAARNLADCDTLYTGMADAARECAVQHFAVGRMVEAYRAVYHAVLAR